MRAFREIYSTGEIVKRRVVVLTRLSHFWCEGMRGIKT